MAKQKPAGSPAKTAAAQQSDAPADLLFADNATASAAPGPTRAEELVQVDASQCLPNQECPLTPNCRGRLQTYNTVSMMEQDDNGNQVRARYQQLRCTKCGRTPSGARRISAAPFAGTKLFNRFTGQSE